MRRGDATQRSQSNEDTALALPLVGQSHQFGFLPVRLASTIALGFGASAPGVGLQAGLWMGEAGVTRRERIVVLLENYEDVVNGLRDRGSEGAHLPLMCRAYNKPRLGYPSLERLLSLMYAQERDLYNHLSKTYTSPKKRVKQCPRCMGTLDIWHTANFHRHSHSNIAVVPRMIRQVPSWVKRERVEEGITWLDERWPEPGPFLPRELQVEKVEAAA